MCAAWDELYRIPCMEFPGFQRVLQSPGKREQKFQACRCFEIGCSLKKSLIFGQCGPENYLASPLVAMHLLLVSYPCRVNRTTNCLITDNIWKAVWHGHYGVLFCYQHAMTPKMMLKWFWFLGFTCPEKVLIFIVTFEWEPWVVSWCQ